MASSLMRDAHVISFYLFFLVTSGRVERLIGGCFSLMVFVHDIIVT
jgi:hypothetical protein